MATREEIGQLGDLEKQAARAYSADLQQSWRWVGSVQDIARMAFLQGIAWERAHGPASPPPPAVQVTAALLADGDRQIAQQLVGAAVLRAIDATVAKAGAADARGVYLLVRVV
jgi:hypothetical protein